MEILPEDIQLFGEYHALIVETAKTYCKKKPACESCPLGKWLEDFEQKSRRVVP
jgi:endonuclease-3 related protein